MATFRPEHFCKVIIFFASLYEHKMFLNCILQICWQGIGPKNVTYQEQDPDKMPVEYFLVMTLRGIQFHYYRINAPTTLQKLIWHQYTLIGKLCLYVFKELETNLYSRCAWYIQNKSLSYNMNTRYIWQYWQSYLLRNFLWVCSSFQAWRCIYSMQKNI